VVAEPPVVNASPFIILALSDRLDLLRLAGERIVVPLRVAQEIRRGAVDDAAVRALGSLDWVEIVDAGEPPAGVRRFRLGAGEAAVLTWTLHHPGTTAILDDARGRRVARGLGMPVRERSGWSWKRSGVVSFRRRVRSSRRSCIRRAGTCRLQWSMRSWLRSVSEIVAANASSVACSKVSASPRCDSPAQNFGRRR
jgi:predicted nucleic acid-binding protein